MEEKFYKPLVETPEGKLVSIWARTAERGSRLEYKEGEITYTPEGTAGIWVSPSIEEARGSGQGNCQMTRAETRGHLVIHEVIPLGKKMAIGEGLRIGSSFSHDTCYPAVLVGKEVWREDVPEEPKGEWKDVTRECEAKISGSAPHWVSILHERRERFLIGSNGVMDWKPGWGGDTYQIETFLGGGFNYECGGFKVWKRVTAEEE